jgi:hypothetical protein
LKISKIASILAVGGIATVGFGQAANATSSPTTTPESTQNPDSNPTPSTGGGAAIPNINNAATLLQSPNASSASSGSFINSGGMNLSFNGGDGSGAIRIGSATCPTGELSLVGSGNGIFQDGSANASTNAANFGGAIVFRTQVGHRKDRQMCSDYLRLQAEDLRNAIDMKTTKTCIEMVQAGVAYYDPSLYDQHMAAMCNNIASQIAMNKPVATREVIKEVPVIQQVPVVIPSPAPAEPNDDLRGSNNVNPTVQVASAPSTASLFTFSKV